MKTIKLIAIVLMLSSLAFAQSDYKTANEFKSKLQEIAIKVEAADSAGELDALNIQLDQLESEFKDERALLDQTLYPENYESSINKIRRAIKTKKSEFVRREVLEVKVDELKGELEILNEQNSNLLSEIKSYQDIGGSPEEVGNLIAQLRATLNKRDQLVENMIDSILSEFNNKPMSLSEAELQKAYEKIESGKLFYNVEKTVRDNMEFLKVTSLSPGELGEVKEDQIQFFRLWKKLGPKVAEAYSGAKNKSEDVAYIDDLFSQWEHQLDSEIWVNIKTAFDRNNIKVENFNSSERFVETFSSYIDSQMVKMDEIGHDASFEQFTKFEKEFWQDELKSVWLPILSDNQMLSDQQFGTLESKMDEWESLYDTDSINLWYFAGAAVIIALLILAFILGGKAKEKKVGTVNSESV